jgi:hypothetical protein
MNCTRCGHILPPLNGVEENDFASLCESCISVDEIDEDDEIFNEREERMWNDEED